jgi:hypothetical protein
LDHGISNGAGTDGQIAACPEMLAPELFTQVRKLLEQDARADAFEPLTIWLISREGW